jgi:phage shock protein PspC (stress-responsive transcriptional regulator)
MLRCSIALAACGVNSQLMAPEGGGDCELQGYEFHNSMKLLPFSKWHSSCSAMGTKICQRSEAMEAHENQIALPLRSHTILGVCEAIGEDFGFNPIFLRVPFAATVLWSPMMAIAAYFALGAIVLASRLVFPKTKSVEAEAANVERAPANEQRELAKAA